MEDGCYKLTFCSQLLTANHDHSICFNTCKTHLLLVINLLYSMKDTFIHFNIWNR